MAKQAKCKKCKVRFKWDREHGLQRSFCPICGEQLQGTTYLLQWPVRDLGRIKPLGLQKRLSESKDGSATVWDWEKDRLAVVPWAQEEKRKNPLTQGENDDSISKD
jgi:hypothetical protein